MQKQLQLADLSALHDAELHLVEMNRNDGKILLGFTKVDQTVCKLLFMKTVTYRIDNIQHQNVVGRILASNIMASFEPALETLVRWTCSAGNTLLISEPKLTDHVNKIIAGDVQLIYIEPSWGAEIGVISKTVSLLYDQE